LITQEVIEHLAGVVGEREVIHDEEELIVYECDAYTLDKDAPTAVVFPQTVEQVTELVKYLNAKQIPYLARGAGTGLSGGCIPAEGGVVIGLNKMNRILEID